MAASVTPVSLPIPVPANSALRFRLEHVPDDALHAKVKALAGRYNGLTADLLAHLAEVEARGIHRERACSSLYTYCVYELRLSEDEAQRRARAARTARAFPVLFEMLADGAIHLTGLLLLAPYLTLENHAEFLARARFRTKREIEHLIAEVAPRPDVPARIEPLGPRPVARNRWSAYAAALAGSLRELAPGLGRGQAPPVDFEDGVGATQRESASGGAGDFMGAGHDSSVLLAELPAPARIDGSASRLPARDRGEFRYRLEFTASRRYVELLEEARDLLQHQVPNRDVSRVHELAMEAFVEQLRRRKRAENSRARAAGSNRSGREGGGGAGNSSAPRERLSLTTSNGSAPARIKARSATPPDDESRNSEPERTSGRHVPAEIRRAVWQRDEERCTFEEGGRRCHERAGLEVHHDQPFARGGPPTLENLRLLCGPHNALLAERDFGRAHVERMRR